MRFGYILAYNGVKEAHVTTWLGPCLLDFSLKRVIELVLGLCDQSPTLSIPTKLTL